MDAIILRDYRRRVEEVQKNEENEADQKLYDQIGEEIQAINESIASLEQTKNATAVESVKARIEDSISPYREKIALKRAEQEEIQTRMEGREQVKRDLIAELEERRDSTQPDINQKEEQIQSIVAQKREQIQAEISAQQQEIKRLTDEKKSYESQLNEQREVKKSFDTAMNATRKAIKGPLTDNLAYTAIKAEVDSASNNIVNLLKKIRQNKQERNIINQTIRDLKQSSKELDDRDSLKANYPEIAQIMSEIEELQTSYTQIDDILSEIDGRVMTQEEIDARDARNMDEIAREKEITWQEDEMWDEYRKEQESTRERQVDIATEMHNDDANRIEKQREDGTKREIEEYGDAGITPRTEEGLPLGPFRVPVEPQGKPTQQPKTQQQPVQPPKSQPINTQPQRPAQTPKTQSTRTQTPQQNSAQPQRPQQPPVQPTKPTHQGLAQNGPYKIEKAGLYISDNGLPTYYVELRDKDGNIVPANYEPNNGFYRIIVPGKEQEPELQSLQNQLIANIKKYYDFGLAGLLQEVDQKFGTSGVSDYQKMLKDKELQVGSKYKAFDIEYDLTKLGNAAIDREDKVKVNYLKKLANANARAGLATYEKAPGILNKISNYLKSLVEKITTKRLKPGIQDNQAHKKPTPEEIVDMYKKSWQDKDFNVEQFIKDCQMTPEEADTFRKVHQNRVKNAQFRKGIAEQAKGATGVLALTEDEKIIDCYKDRFSDRNFDPEKQDGLSEHEKEVLKTAMETYHVEQKIMADRQKINSKRMKKARKEVAKGAKSTFIGGKSQKGGYGR